MQYLEITEPLQRQEIYQPQRWLKTLGQRKMNLKLYCFEWFKSCSLQWYPGIEWDWGVFLNLNFNVM